MPRLVLLLPLVLGLSAVRGQAEDERGDKLVRELQARVERVSREARGSIACVLVSRSDAYHKARYWGEPGNPEHPGQLGRFDAAAARKLIPEDALNRTRLLRQINDHDLADSAVVPESYGSGFVLDKSGLVLTNAHVVKNATRIYVRLPDRRGSWADIHASDPRSDLAVLKLLDAPAGLEPLSLGEGGSVRTGQFVVSIANAFAPGFRNGGPTSSYGMVSNLGRRIPGKTNELRDLAKLTLHHYGTLIQTDAQTTPGCSGGALLDLNGKVVGLTTALPGIRGDRPGGFAIPCDKNIGRIIEVLRKGEEVEYGFLGVVLNQQHELADEPPTHPVRLDRISPGSPASRAGLLNGDVVVSINGHMVQRNDDLFLYIGMGLAGSTAEIEITRTLPGGFPRTYKYNVKLAKFHVPGPVIASKRPAARFGLRVDYTSILSQRNPFQLFGRGPAQGVIVREVVPDSPADSARLQPDKIITQVNGRPVITPAEYYQEIARAGRKVELTFLTSDGRPERLTLEEK